MRVPPDAAPPCYLFVEGVDDPPEGDLVLVLRRKPRLFDLFRSAALTEAEVEAERLGEAADGEKAIDSGRRN